jgi:ankyrin repeat protein
MEASMKNLCHLLLGFFILVNLSLQAMNHEQQQKLNQQFFAAFEKGDISNVTTLIQAGADVNTQDQDGHTLLHMAVDGGHVDLASFLLKHGADINKADKNRWTSLYIATQKNYLTLAHILNLFNTPAMQAFRVDPKRYLEEHSADECTLGATLLHFAVLCNNADIVQELLKEKAAVLAGDERKHSPLMYALWFGHTAIAQELINTLAEQRKGNVVGALTLGDLEDRCTLSYITQKNYRFLNYLITQHRLLRSPTIINNG